MKTGKREIERLCRAKLYELELMEYAEKIIRPSSEEMAELLVRSAVKTLGDCRRLLCAAHVKITPRGALPRDRSIQGLLSEIAEVKREWVSLAQELAPSLSGELKELLLKLCESERDEIYKIKRCVC